MSKAVWIAFAENLEQQVEKNQRVIEEHLVAHLKQGAQPDDLYDPLIEDLRTTNAQLRRLAADARARIANRIGAPGSSAGSGGAHSGEADLRPGLAGA